MSRGRRQTEAFLRRSIRFQKLNDFSTPPKARRNFLYKFRCDNFYNISSVIGNGQKAGIGYGSKIKMTNSTVEVPSPHNYSIRSLFDGCKKGYIFGIGR